MTVVESERTVEIQGRIDTMCRPAEFERAGAAVEADEIVIVERHAGESDRRIEGECEVVIANAGESVDLRIDRNTVGGAVELQGVLRRMQSYDVARLDHQGRRQGDGRQI